jgi:superfamily II DNA/RNA helicase
MKQLSMTYPKYQFTINDLEISSLGRLTTEEARKLTLTIFDTWRNSQEGASSSPSAQVSLSATLTQRTEGASDAEVYEVNFFRRGKPPIARFIARIHHDAEGSNTAAQERLTVSRLAATGLDVFASQVVASDQIPDNMVIYRHAGDELGADTQSLGAYLPKIFSDRDTEGIQAIGAELIKLLSDVTKAYNVVSEDIYLTNGSQLLSRHLDRLVPDLIIDARNRKLTIAENVVTILTADGDAPGLPTEIPFSSIEHAIKGLDEFEGRRRQWQRFQLWRDRRRRSATTLRFKKKNLSVWLRVDAAVDVEMQTTETEPVELLLNWTDCLIDTARTAVAELGFESEGIASRAFFGEHLTDHANFPERLRHTDLHVGNILHASRRLKVIDLLSSDRDLPAVAHARLEISLWRALASALELSARDFIAILDTVAGRATAPTPEDHWQVWAISHLLTCIRTSYDESHGKGINGTPDGQLAYAIQIGLLQRYLLESEQPAPLPLVLLANESLRAFTQSPPAATQISLPEGSSVAASESAEPYPTIGSLWVTALSRGAQAPDSRAARLLQSIRLNSPLFFQSPLTELQANVARYGPHSVFHDHQHVMIAGPTGSGKTTLAEMFLTAATVLNTRRRRSLYIAPTRALAQAKYRDLLALFEGDAALSKGCVLSTGEDRESDWRIVHGQFLVACMVYEKANILFSRNRRLLDGLGCVVVDEVHMLADLERGPILEMVLSKVLRQRLEDDALSTRESQRDQIRVVVLSTEDTPDVDLLDFLSTRDANGRLTHPLTFRASHRPVPVAHNLVLPGDADTAFTLAKIADFGVNEVRAMTEQDLRVVDSKIDSLSLVLNTNLPERFTVADRNIEIRTRAVELVVELIRRRPTGFRVLVFVPGRADAEELAQRLKNRLRELAHTDHLSRADPEILRSLRPDLDKAEDSLLVDTIKRCAADGVLVHHADVERKVRETIERLCQRSLGAYRSEIVVATETLAYGVNLGINDVVLVGTTFHSQTRMREPRDQQLAICAFHNMVGRAGRLGSRSQSPGVYVIVAADERPMDVVRMYYTGPERTVSRLFVSDDKQAAVQRDHDKFAAQTSVASRCGRYSDLGPLNFSYPFVRSVLDALRHLNMRRTDALGIDVRSPVSLRSVLDLFNDSAYAYQILRNRKDEKEAVFFECGVERILEGSALAPLHLVERTAGSAGLYAITPRGEAIIDTGTELQTVEPVLRLVNEMRNLWTGRPAAMPIEIFILCLLGQDEIFRQCIRYAPECRRSDRRGWSRTVADQNRAAVLREVELALAKCGERESAAIASDLRDVVYRWEPLVKVASAYSNGAADAVLRIFCAAVAWVRGEEQGVVLGYIEDAVMGPEYSGRVQGWRQLTEVLNWKMLFLAKMLGTAKAADSANDPAEERGLQLLAARLRLGCSADAVPLFWPRSSDIRRREAVLLIRAGMTPGRIASLGEPQRTLERSVPEIKPGRLDGLRTDLGNFALSSFAELRAEMTAAPANDAKTGRARALWDGTDSILAEAIDSFGGRGKLPLRYDARIREALSPSDGQDPIMPARDGAVATGKVVDREYIVRFERAEGAVGLTILGEPGRSERTQSDPRVAIRRLRLRAIGLQMRHDWTCRIDGEGWKNFALVLAQYADVKHLLFVVIPWTPYHGELPEAARDELEARANAKGTVSIVTPAAFALMASAILRDFTNGESLLSLLAQPPSAELLSMVDVRRVQEALQFARAAWPESIREKLISHFEIDPSVAAREAAS